uniref:Uncharacterized protein n=1 Tax=Panagrolaimus davidi TaxID=227884 RepID=A0A914PS86_9BILA
MHYFDQNPRANEEEEERLLPKNPFFTRYLGQVPAVILVLFAIVLFVVFSIPLIFVFTQSSYQQMLPPTDAWPNDDDYGYQNESISKLAALLPKNVTICRAVGFLCANHPSIVIGTNSLCDGVADCPDGSDEADCSECKTSFYCLQSSNSSKLCLRAKALFDGQPHCADESDEKVYEQQNQGKCPVDKLKCSSMCLPKILICDGEHHCPSGEDERNCEGKCQNGSKFCKSLQQCLPKWTLCNGIKDCDDGSDEDDCDCMQCSGQHKMLCKSSPGEKGYCLNGDRVCDGRRDCPNGEDEDGCPGEINMDEIEMIKCKDGKLYSKVYACLGLIPSCEDCDECKKNCTKEIQFKCKNEVKYISQASRCDGQDCSAKECGIHPFSMYLCEDGKHCFRREEVCTPYSVCPISSKLIKDTVQFFVNHLFCFKNLY